MTFSDRRTAGQQLAQRLAPLCGRQDLLVLALPRGGVPVANPIAESLHAPLDVLLVRKLGVPGHEELAMGAVASGGILLLDEQVVQSLRVPRHAVQETIERQRHELLRLEDALREGQPPVAVRGKGVILVDDGIATGSTMEAAILAIRQQDPALIVVAVPVASPTAVARLSVLVDELIAIEQPEDFHAVGQFYENFPQLDDRDVRRLLGLRRD